jgi:hypothetical protein
MLIRSILQALSLKLTSVMNAKPASCLKIRLHPRLAPEVLVTQSSFVRPFYYHVLQNGETYRICDCLIFMPSSCNVK